MRLIFKNILVMGVVAVLAVGVTGCKRSDNGASSSASPAASAMAVPGAVPGAASGASQ